MKTKIYAFLFSIFTAFLPLTRNPEPGSALVMPPYSPGSFGDEAVVTSVVVQLARQGVKKIGLISYRDDDDWSYIQPSGLAEKCEIELAYAIGVAEPISIMVDTFGTGKISDDEISALVSKNFDLRPAGIIKMLDLRRPIYKQTAAYGHFGRNDIDVPWEKTDKADTLRKEAGL